MDRSADWLKFLLNDEFGFNEEVHLLGSREKKIEALPPDGHLRGAGWFLTWSDTEAGEWNLAHAFGDPLLYAGDLSEFPVGVTFQLFVPLADAESFSRASQLPMAERLIWHRSEIPGLPVPGAAGGETRFDLPPFSRRFLQETPAGPFQWPLKAYLLRDNSVVCLIKSIHATPGTVEVYIETIPEIRNQGSGSYLLQEVLKIVHRHQRRLIYVTSETNLPSIRVAAKAALKPYLEMGRFPFTRQGA